MSYLPCAICAFFGAGTQRGVAPAATSVLNLGVMRDEVGISRDVPLTIEHVIAVALCQKDHSRIVASLRDRGRPDPKHGFALEIDKSVRDVMGGKPFGPKDVNPAVRDAVTRLLMHRTRFITLPDFMVTEAEDILGITAKPAAEQGQQQSPQPQPVKTEAKAEPKKPAPAQPTQIKKPILCRLTTVDNATKGAGREDLEATYTVEPDQLCRLLDIKPEWLTNQHLLAVAFNDAWLPLFDKQGVKYVGLGKALGMMNPSARVSLVQASHMEVDTELAWAVQVMVFGEKLGVMVTDAADLPRAYRLVCAMSAPTAAAYEDEAAPVTLEHVVKEAAAGKRASK